MSECFVDLPIVDQLKDFESPKCILLGRTGTGKTAILNNIEAKNHNCIRLDPKDIAFDYIANSNIISFLFDSGCNLSLLFQYLWKHVFCTKVIQKYFENRNIFDVALDSLSKAKSGVKTYIERYSDKFWIEHDVVIREISDSFAGRLESELRSALGAEFAKIESGMMSELNLSSSQRKEIIARAQKAVSDMQIRELARAIDSLNEIMNNRQKQYYVIIDELDLDWVDSSIKYSLIRSLIESAKSLRKLRNVKIIIALRTDLYERSINDDNIEGIQPEKYEGMICDIRWSEKSLKNVVDKRIEFMFKRVYTKQGVKFSDIFPAEIRKKESFEYIVERTLYRPRDIIAFLNAILDISAGFPTISTKNVTEAEANYSRKRFDALCREWETLHPHLKIYLGFLRGRTGKHDVSTIALREIIMDVCLAVDDAGKEGQVKDSVERQCEIYSKRENPSKLRDVASSLLAVFYKVGAVELKLSKGDVFRACYKNESHIAENQIGLDAAFRVTPMLWRSLGITPNLG
ncbi:hypothetical protein BR10RB9215_C20802 [Brucella sp. 10RB9215]|uniref:P-loop ATPase, Sll1717 family n=1 Tax=Brucella sp. 10RB9215 TaxID=1149953 RepID=UPI00090B7E91|nr:hypothetical protein [Brucella sp. 10RB9215]SBW16133.1 hypothetical protein BR10RB9215_C20802 [Brucella sp. 10RB9215]